MWVLSPTECVFAGNQNTYFPEFKFDKKSPAYWRDFCMLALPIFPASRPASIVGADELNFCVRDGNRWTLIAINTNYFGWVLPHHLC